MTTDTRSLRERTTSGVVWTAVQKWVVRLTGFATLAVLARVLGPGDFGLVAAAATVMPFLYLLSDMGFTTFLVQAESVRDSTLNTAFWFSSCTGAVLGGALAAAGLLLGDHLTAGVGEVLAVLASAVVLVSGATVPTALLRRRMEFRRLAVQAASGSLAGQLIAMYGALTGWGVWALVAQMLAQQVVCFALVWRAARWTPRAEFSRSEFRKMASFGVRVVGVEVVGVLRLWAETLIVTLGLGITGLGYLNVAQRLIQVAQDLTVSAVMPVATVAFTKIRDSGERLRQAYLNVCEVTYGVATPFVVVLVVGGSEAVRFVYGPGWDHSAAPTQILAAASLMVVGSIVDNSLCYATGRPGAWFVYALLTDFVTVFVTAGCVKAGLTGVSLGFLGVAAAALLARALLMARVTDTHWRILLLPFARAAAVATAAAMTASLALWPIRDAPAVIRLVVIGLVVAVTFLTMASRFLPETARVVRGLFRRVVTSVLRAARRPTVAVQAPSTAARHVR